MIYEVILSNYSDDTTKSIFVLSNELIYKESSTIYTILGIDEEYEYIKEVKSPNIIVNAWNEDEFNELEKVKNTLLIG